MEVITAVRSRSAVSPGGITFSDGGCHQRPDGALGFARSCRPIKTVVLAFITENLPSILVVLRLPKFLFRRSELLANTDGRQFVAANSPVQNFLLACLGVEVPRVIALVYERYGCGPVLRADI